MQKTLACVAMLLAGSLAGCSKEKQQEGARAGNEVQPRGHSVPTYVAEQKPTETEEQLDFESEWKTEPGMTPASGTQPMTPAAGTTVPVERPSSAEALGTGSPVVLQFEGANHLSQALCAHETACGHIAPTEGWCEEVVKSQVMDALSDCTQGLSRAELRDCLSTIDQSSCQTTVEEETALRQCRASNLCAR